MCDIHMLSRCCHDAAAIQRLRDEEAAAVEAEDFDAAAELSGRLDATARYAGAAAEAARDAEAGCESAMRRRVEVGQLGCCSTAYMILSLLPCLDLWKVLLLAPLPQAEAMSPILSRAAYKTSQQ